MDYFETNKAAWEEAFERRQPGWGDNNHTRLGSERLAFFDSDLKAELEQTDLRGKHVAQFCCNNGRELLSLTDLGITSGVGFDFAENILNQAVNTAEQAGITNCRFVLGNILDIPSEYSESFDFILITIGAIAWFADPDLILGKAAACLKSGGRLLINDQHPFTCMLPYPGEDDFDPNDLGRLAYSYFHQEPWVEINGMHYMSGEYRSKPFTSFSHSLGSIINSLAANGMRIRRFTEYDYDIGLGDIYDNRGFPLSYILVADKE